MIFYSWDFGDGNKLIEKLLFYVFVVIGIFMVFLMVIGEGGINLILKMIDVMVILF